ncbi:MAG: Trm112 family protein [Acidimicrobiales bacterium]
MALDPQLLALLACPEDKGPLFYFADEETLYNPRLRRRYRIVDGIPVMLVDESETVGEDEHARLMAKAASEAITPNFESGDDAGGAASS